MSPVDYTDYICLAEGEEGGGGGGLGMDEDAHAHACWSSTNAWWRSWVANYAVSSLNVVSRQAEINISLSSVTSQTGTDTNFLISPFPCYSSIFERK